MIDREVFLVIAFLCGLLQKSTAQCQIDGVVVWQLPVSLSVVDTDRGEFFRAGTTNILTIASAEHTGDVLNQGPYLEAQLVGNEFVLSLNDNFDDYEEYEYGDTMNILVSFTCTGGSSSLVFTVLVVDTNNNAPRFLPSDAYNFNIAPPIVPGYELTGCYGDIIARDIDLTTQSIIFGIEENPYFEVDYGGRDPSDSKNFFAVLRATSLIRSLAEPLVLQMSAQDVDTTGDLPLTTFATITIEATDQYEFPSEPVFSQPFYTATYSSDHLLTVEQTITLSEGYDGEVTFNLTGDHLDYFSLTAQGNLVNIQMLGQLPAETLQDAYVALVVQATKEYTSGDTAAVIVTLPVATNLRFEQVNYEGIIADNVLQLLPLVLSEGYSDGVTATVTGDYGTYFTAQVTENIITVTMSTIPEDIIQDNGFINIVVDAISGTSTNSAVVTLDIVKDDTITPVFDQDFYSGNYDRVDGLVISTLSLMQGYDETVFFSIVGEFGQYFNLTENGNSVSIVLVTSLPDELITAEQQLLFTVRATKAGTVGASATISVSLPSARIMTFEQENYIGSIQDNILQMSSITLADGYTDDVTFTISGDLNTSFSISNEANIVNIDIATPLTQEELQENKFLILILEATGVNAVTVSTAIVLDIIKDDTSTPLFSERVYNGIYSESQLVNIETTIILSQGYDESVTFDLDGENSQYFSVVGAGENLEIVVLEPLPDDVLEANSFIVFSVIAAKPGTVGANAAVSLTLPQTRELRFQQDIYTGTIENDELFLPSIILAEGYREDVIFSLTGEYTSYFNLSIVGNALTIEAPLPLPADLTDANSFVILLLEASGPNALSTRTAIMMELIKDDISTLVFSQYVYTGVYNGLEDFTLDSNINVSQGYDETVVLTLDGDQAHHFNIQHSENTIILNTISAIPDDVLASNTGIVFTVVATKEGTVSANAAVSIKLPEIDNLVPRFDQSSYTGTVQEDLFVISDIITLVEGYNEDITFNINGLHSTYFNVSNFGNIVNIQMPSALPQQVTDNYNFVVLELEASGPQSITAFTTIVLEIIKEDIMEPVFSDTFYTGTYTEADGLTFEDTITLVQGFDETVTFELIGDDAQWFTITQTGNITTLIISSPISTDVLANRQHLLFTVMANKPDTLGATAAISILLPDDLTAATVLRFEQASYVGSVLEETMQLDPITMAYGYQEDVIFSLSGEYVSYFTYSNVGNIVTIQMASALPESVTVNSAIVILELAASGPQAISAQTAIVLEIIDDNSIVAPVFSDTFYTGTYTEADGLTFEDTITLVQGFDETVTFELIGDDAQWFTITQTGNITTLIISSPISTDVLANRQHLLFTVMANKPDTLGATAAISILLPDDLTAATVLRFEQASYVGSVLEETMQLDPITLAYGYQEDVIFSLSGEYVSYFTYSNVGNIVTIQMASALPESVTVNSAIVILELAASGPQAISAQTAIVLEIIDDNSIVAPVFSDTFYTGTYTEADGLTFEDTITLVQGFDETVTFELIGDDAQWFTITQTGNITTLIISSPISTDVLANRQHLLFTVMANKPDTLGATAAISILLPDDLTAATVLRFEQASYVGSVLEETMQLDPITLAYGYQEDVIFSLSGEYVSYFTYSNVGNIVTIQMASALPESVTVNSAIVILELAASGPQAISAQTAIVLEIIDDNSIVAPVFSDTFYTGTYTEADGLTFEDTITLVQGFDETVTFELIGDDAQWFTITQTGNITTLIISSPISTDVLANRQHLLFTVMANKPDTLGATAAISILLPDDLTAATVLRFEQASYVGSVLEETMQLDPITLAYGYQEDVIFSLSGEYVSYFTYTNVGNIVTVQMASALPESVTVNSAIVILELAASGPQAISAQTAIVLEIIDDNSIVAPVFSDTFYTGTYTEADGLTFEDTITLVQGFDETVTFELIGDDAQWFTITQTGNITTLIISSPISTDVLANRQHLLFTVMANKPDTLGATAAISILLPDDLTAATVLRFEQASYVGSVLEETMQLDPITLAYGYQEDVIFSLSGEYVSYFTYTNVGNIVTVQMASALPESVTVNSAIVILELAASGPQAISAQTAIVLEIIDDNSIEAPVFSDTFYTGTYTEADGLTFEDTITLVQGFDETVTFELIGDDAQWFTITQTGNITTLIISSPISTDVLANRQHLLFTVMANKPDTLGATAAISILLPDDLTAATVLRFEQASYVGSVLEETMQLDPITLAYGYQEDVIFSLSGEYVSYFTYTNVGNIVTVQMASALPESVTVNSAIVILELAASGPQAISAQTAIVLEIIDDNSIVAPVFSDTFYTGTYTEADGLTFEDTITLVQGFDETVTFELIGDDAQWFTITQTGNITTLIISSPISTDVLANRQHLLFTVMANKPDTLGATAAISILLPDDLTAATVLRFEQASYVGSVLEETMQLDPITLAYGYQEDVIFSLSGEYVGYFTYTNVGNIVTVQMASALPESVTVNSAIVILELAASGPQAISAQTAIVLEIIDDNSIEAPVFSDTFYTGTYTEADGLTFEDTITLVQGFDETVTFELIGDDSQWFTITQTENITTLIISSPISTDVLANRQHLLFTVMANKPDTLGATAAISILLPDDLTAATVLRFEQASYVGSVLEETMQLDPITLAYGYQEDVIFSLSGEYVSYFTYTNVGNIVTVQMASALPESVTVNSAIVILELAASGPQAISAQTAIVLEIIDDNSIVAPVFSDTFYTGTYTEANGLTFEDTITLVQGFDETVTFELIGDDAEWFTITQTGNTAALTISSPISTDVLANRQQLLFSVIANKPATGGAGAAISISLPNDGSPDVFFDKGLYLGLFELGTSRHDSIQLHGYSDTTVELTGEYSTQFSGAVEDGSVEIQAVPDAFIPPDATHVALQIEAGAARAALVLTVILTDPTAEPPTIEFSSPSFVFRTDIAQTGVIGRVDAAASNGETIAYTLILNNVHLQERLSVTSDGDLRLSATANSGIYQFSARATTVATQVTAYVTVHLTIDSVTVCGMDERILPPLIVIDREEEEPHEDIVILNENLASLCSYDFTYRWPLDKDWLYINDRGHLSTRVIDREDPAIAFMALSQVQIELVLSCIDDPARTKREVSNYLGPYDYGNGRWILTEGISYNSRRSLVNIIINDINDNHPIFVGKENEPIIIGYPVPELLDTVAPTALIILQATDADIDENAEVDYWTEAPELVVSRLTGAVHVRDNAARVLQSGARFTVYATDRSGAAEGSLTGEIDILVRLLELQHIAVLTVRNTLLEDEVTILQQLRISLNYEVKSLRATVISDEYEVTLSTPAIKDGRNETNVNSENIKAISNKKKNRETDVVDVGASLRMFVYGLVDTEPIEAVVLISDIENSAITLDWTASYEILENHLDDVVTIPGSGETGPGLLISTVILSVLLVLLIVFLLVWYLVKIRKGNIYEQFSDTTSQVSNQNIYEHLPKPEDITRPRPNMINIINIQEIKRTERRLQEMLDQPVAAPEPVKPVQNGTEVQPAKPTVTFATISEIPQPDEELPVVIQSIDKLKDAADDTDDDDEFGEANNNRKKPVVTFNEHVEKIIHVENTADEFDEDVQIYRL